MRTCTTLAAAAVTLALSFLWPANADDKPAPTEDEAEYERQSATASA